MTHGCNPRSKWKARAPSSSVVRLLSSSQYLLEPCSSEVRSAQRWCVQRVRGADVNTALSSLTFLQAGKVDFAAYYAAAPSSLMSDEAVTVR